MRKYEQSTKKIYMDKLLSQRSMLFIAAIKREEVRYKSSQVVYKFVTEYFKALRINFLFFKTHAPSKFLN